MIHVIFDTSGIGKNKNVGDANYSALKRLVEANEISIHVPYIVKKELETQERAFYAERHKALLDAIKKFNSITKSDDLNSSISNIKNQIDDLKDTITKDYSRFSTAWIEGLNSQVYDITIDQTYNAWDSYFEGTRPFKEPKNRADIPDSFICRSIEDIISNIEIENKIILIINDNKVLDNFKDFQNIEIFKNIISFIKSDQIKALLSKTDSNIELNFFASAGKAISKITVGIESSNPHSSWDILIKAHERKNKLLHNYIRFALPPMLEAKTIKGMPYSNDYNNEASITYCEEIKKIDIDFKNTIHYGKDHFGFNFYAEVLASTAFFVDKLNYFSSFNPVTNKTPDFNIENWNKYEFRADRFVKLKVNGIVTVNLGFNDADYYNLESSTSDELIALMEYYIEKAQINIDEITEITIKDQEES